MNRSRHNEADADWGTGVRVSFDDELRVDPFDEIHLLSHEFVLEPPHPFLDESQA